MIVRQNTACGQKQPSHLTVITERCFRGPRVGQFFYEALSCQPPVSALRVKCSSSSSSSALCMDIKHEANNTKLTGDAIARPVFLSLLAVYLLDATCKFV